MGKPYQSFFDGLSRRNGWVVGEDKGQMVLGVPTADGGQRPIVVAEFQDSSGQLALRFWAPVAPIGKVPPDQALKLNYQLPHGALAEKEGQVVIVATRVFNGINAADVTNVIAALAHFSGFYAKHYGGA